MGVVSTTAGKCRKCYSCVRNCPVKAIKVENSQAQVLSSLCISCGYCIKVCSQKAKQVESELDSVKTLLAGAPTVVCLAPSFAVEFYPVPPGSVITALLHLGFREVYEVAYGAELVTARYLELLNTGDYSQGLISTTCPAIVQLVERQYPELLPRLVPVVSPMIATAQYIKSIHPHYKVVFIGPCVAKKEEAKDPLVAGYVDAVLTFNELRLMWQEQQLDPADQAIGQFSNPATSRGRLYPVAGGLLASANLAPDFINRDLIIVHGKENCLEFLGAAAEGKVTAGFVDILYCEGCINGPMMDNDLPKYTRQKIITWYFKNKGILNSKPRDGHKETKLNLDRQFKANKISFPIPSEEEIKNILESLNKFKPEDELNCGSCGYSTCREKAVAVYQGLAENVMCLPFLISELEKNNQELTFLKDYNNNIVESITEAILVVNRAGILTTYHDPNHVLGRQDKKLYLGKSFLELMPSSIRQDVEHQVADVMQSGINLVISDIYYPTEQGKKILNLKGYPFKDKSGQCSGAVLICEDTTLEKQLEAQLLAAEKLASVGRLAAGVAHEINNPLSLISGYTELLRANLPAGNQEAQHKLTIISEEVDRIASIVRNLLTLAKPASAELAACDINELIRHTVELVAHQYERKGLSIELDLAPGLPLVELNKAELEQVLLNLVLNAYEAMESEGLLTIQSFATREGLAIILRDTGHGIPEAHLSKIFEPFFTTKDIGQGTGLGLAVSYSIIQKYGGNIKVESTSGQGATFTIELPVTR